MDDPDGDSTWEGDEEDGEEGGEEGGPGDAEPEEEETRPGAPQVLGPRCLPRMTCFCPGPSSSPRLRQLGSTPPYAPCPCNKSRPTGSRNWRAVRDTRRYRHHYPDLIERDSNGDMPNLSFYRNEIRFLPNGCFIEDILQNWRDDYDLLEDNHSYIQWLFPLREPGVNWHAKPLTQREIEAFKSSKEARERFVQAYELMLGFYGIELEDRDTGKVRRAQSYQKRFQNLNWHSHNNLRITRILKSLGELGLERYQAPLVRFFLEETLVRGQLPGVRQSALDYFLFTVRCARQRRALLRFAWEHFRPRSGFVWAPRDKLRRRRARSPPRAPLPEGPARAEGEEGPGDPLAAGAPGRACGPGEGEGGDSVAEGPRRPSPEPREGGAPEGDPGEAAGSQGEEGPEPSSPKESKKRKLEENRPERAPGDAGPQSASEVEIIALNLEGCALSQGSVGAGTQEMDSQDPGETEQPGPRPPGAEVADEVRKRRKVDQALDPAGRPEAGGGENGAEGEAGGGGAPEEGASGSPAAAAAPASGEGAGPAERAGLAATPQTPGGGAGP